MWRIWRGIYLREIYNMNVRLTWTIIISQEERLTKYQSNQTEDDDSRNSGREKMQQLYFKVLFLSNCNENESQEMDQSIKSLECNTLRDVIPVSMQQLLLCEGDNIFLSCLVMNLAVFRFSHHNVFRFSHHNECLSKLITALAKKEAYGCLRQKSGLPNSNESVHQLMPDLDSKDTTVRVSYFKRLEPRQRHFVFSWSFQRNWGHGNSCQLFRWYWSQEKKVKERERSIVHSSLSGSLAGTTIVIFFSRKEEDEVQQSWWRESGRRWSSFGCTLLLVLITM